MKEVGSCFAGILALFLAIFGIVWTCQGVNESGEKRIREIDRLEKQCTDSGGQVLHQRGDDVCIKDGKITFVIPF